MEAIVDYAFPIEWADNQSDGMKSWLSDSWMKLEGVTADQDFVDYIIVRKIPNNRLFLWLTTDWNLGEMQV